MPRRATESLGIMKIEEQATNREDQEERVMIGSTIEAELRKL